MNMASRLLAMDAEKVTKQMLTCIGETDIGLPEVKTPALRSAIGFSAKMQRIKATAPPDDGAAVFVMDPMMINRQILP